MHNGELSLCDPSSQQTSRLRRHLDDNVRFWFEPQ